MLTYKTIKQIAILRDIGTYNMFHAKAIQRLAYELDFYELVTLISENTKDYRKFIKAENLR